jgi:ABC-2 type transport system permease protein
MLRNVFLKSLRDQRWALVGWGTGVVLLVLIESSVWPTVRDMPDFSEFVQAYPEAMQELFDLESMATASGFMNAELFTLVLPLLFIIFGISRGARLIAGEEEGGTLEVLLVTRVSTTSLVLQKAAALATALLALGAMVFLTFVLTGSAFDLDIGADDLAVASLVMVLMGVEFGFLALAVGAATGRRALALGIAGTAAIASYLLYALGLIVDFMEPWRPFSPFDQALSGGPLGGALPASIGWVVLVAVVALAAALPVFARRDIQVH